MATDSSFVEYVAEQANLPRLLTWRKMFGEYALYLQGKVVAFACDNSLYLKPTDAGGELLPNRREGFPYPGAKAHFLIDELLDDADLLQQLFLITAEVLPEPKPKKPRVKRKNNKKNIIDEAPDGSDASSE